MTPGKLYRSVSYNTQVWEDIDFEINEGQYYVSNLLMYMDSATVFMVIENMKDDPNPRLGSNKFSKILDANGNVGYICSNDFNLLFKEVME